MVNFWLNLGVYCWILTVNANVLPRETGCHKDSNNVVGWTPKPTSGPVAEYAPLELFKRQQTTNTCGYFDGIASDPFTCQGAGYCAYNTLDSAAGCCTGILTDCYLFTVCFDYNAYESGECSNAGPFTGCCTDAQYPNCATLYFPSQTMYQCDVHQTTFSLEYTPVVSSAIISTPVTSSTPVQSSTPPTSNSPTPTSSSTTLSMAASTTSSSTPPPTPAPSGSSSAPIGAIVGGVVGGIAVIALIGLLIFFIMRSRRRSGRANDPAQLDPSVQQPVQHYMQQPPMQPMQPPMQQQGYAAPVYYTDQQTYPDNRQSMMKPTIYDSVTEQNEHGKYQSQGESMPQTAMSSPNPTYSPPSPGPPMYNPQNSIPTAAEMSGVPNPHPGAAELSQR